MRVAIVPHFEQLRVLVNPDGKVSPEVCSSSYLPGLYAPWPDAQGKGFVEIDIEGDTLRALLAEIGDRYKQAKVDFEPICPVTNNVNTDFDVFVNGKSFTLLDHGLDSKLRDGDEVKISSDTMGHC